MDIENKLDQLEGFYSAENILKKFWTNSCTKWRP